MSSGWATHDIEMAPTRVVKRFRSCRDGEPEREWRALSLLTRYAPDLAPAPLSADLAGGRSDRAYELADIVEHLAAWVDTDFDAALFLAHFTLTGVETRRLRDSRRLFALLWLLVLALEDPGRPRNPPGTAARQAERLLTLLS